MILPFVLLYIGVTFYLFSRSYEQSALFFILIGILTYFVGATIGAFLYSVMDNGNVNFQIFITSLMGVPTGLLACLLLKSILKKKLRLKKVDINNDDILDDI